jgi:hypothetical protein
MQRTAGSNVTTLLEHVDLAASFLFGRTALAPVQDGFADHVSPDLGDDGIVCDL